MGPKLEIAAIALVCSVTAPVLAAPMLHWFRRASLRVWGATIIAVGVSGMVAAVAVTARAMFLSEHDLDVVFLVVAVSGAVTALMTLWLGLPVTRASRALTHAAHRLGGTDYRSLAPQPPSAELAAIARALDDTHARLLAATERERALEASRRELVAWVSHDLRTPIAGIRAVAEALDDGVVTDPDTVAAYHRTMVMNAERLTTLIDELFELSRLHSGALELTLENVRVADVVSDVISATDPIARAKGVRLTGKVDETDRFEVDVVEVGRVLTNLVANAIRHTPGDGTVAVAATVTDGRAELSVSDACGGIPTTDLDRLFDTGYRGESARTPPKTSQHAGSGSYAGAGSDAGSYAGAGADAGAGIGLAIVRAVVEAHGGEVSVHNIIGGCRFVVGLPAAS